jgi:hypothetical protein
LVVSVCICGSLAAGLKISKVVCMPLKKRYILTCNCSTCLISQITAHGHGKGNQLMGRY